MKNYVLLIVFVFFLQKANSQIHYVRKNSKVSDIVMLQPRVCINTIESGNKYTVNYGLTQKALNITNEIIDEAVPDSLIVERHHTDSLKDIKVTESLYKLNKQIRNSKSPKRLKIHKSFTNLFDTATNYVMITFVEGFTRERDNLINQAIIHKLSRFLIGTNTRPLAQNLMVGCCVIDVKKRRLVIYERNEWHEKDPNQEKNLTMALKQILNHHF